MLAQEVADLIVALGAGSAAVAGHDWGGALAWLLAMQHPERVQRLVILNAPHPIRFLKGLRSPRQLRRSWYILAFQLPWLPERLVRPGTSRRCAGPCAASRPGRAPSPPRTSTATSPRPLSRAPCAPPSTTTGPPSAGNPLAQVHTLRRVDIPTLVIWGDQDRYLGRELAEPDRAWVPEVRVERIPRPATGCRPTPPAGQPTHGGLPPEPIGG